MQFNRFFTTALIFLTSINLGWAQQKINVPSSNHHYFVNAINPPPPWYSFQIKVLPVLLCNDDGSDPGTITRDQMQNGIHEANLINERSGVKWMYVIDSRANFSTCVRSTVMNNDCILPEGVNPDQIADYVATFTTKDADGNGKENKDDKNAICDFKPSQAAREVYALNFLGSIPMYFAGMEHARKTIEWSEDQGHYYYKKPTGGFSSYAASYIVMNDLPPPAPAPAANSSIPTFSIEGVYVAPKNMKLPGNLYAHEIGHFLGLSHTFYDNQPKDRATLVEKVQKYMDKEHLGAADIDQVMEKLFDADIKAASSKPPPQILDTPVDPGSTYWKSEFPGRGEFCKPNNDHVDIDIPLTNGEVAHYTFRPDRSLIMSYFKGCTQLNQRYSPNEVQRMEGALEAKRSHLVHHDVVSCFENEDRNISPQVRQDLYPWFNQRSYILNECLEAIRQRRIPERVLERALASDMNLTPIELTHSLLRQMEENIPLEDFSTDPLEEDLMIDRFITPPMQMPQQILPPKVPDRMSNL